jgi:hypothetical protein
MLIFETTTEKQELFIYFYVHAWHKVIKNGWESKTKYI